MNVLQKLTVRHLRLNRRRTLITIVGVVLSVAMVTAVSGMVVSFQDLLYRDSVAREGAWHVRYSGISPETAEQIGREAVFSHWELIETDEGPELSLEFERLHKGIFDESEAVCRKYGVAQEQVRYHNDLLIAKGIVPGPYYRALYSFAGILLGLIAAGSVLVIYNAFAISADQRSLQFGLLKSAGATGRQIRGMVLFEGVVLAAAAIPPGILAGLCAQWVALSIANGVLEPMMVNVQVPFRVVVSPAALGTASLAAVLTVLCAAWLPAGRAANMSAVDAIRQTGSFRLPHRQARVPLLVRRLFGLEGTLAAKAMTRNRGKYRTTVLALVVSIVLFIGVSSFGSILMKATGMMYQDLGSNVLVTMRGDTRERHDELAALLTGLEGVRAFPTRDVQGTCELPQKALTEEYKRYFPEAAPQLRLFTMGDDELESLCWSLRISPDGLEKQDGIGGILVNTTGTYIRQGRRISFTPYRLGGGDSIPIAVGETELELHLLGSTDQIPPGGFLRMSSTDLNVIVSQSSLVPLLADGQDVLWLAVQAEDAQSFVSQAQELLDRELPNGDWSAMDYEKMAANNRNISALVMLFVYGFIAMLTLIGVTSVITTISTGIALRTREFAMLQSVGMTEGSLTRMLRYESLLYGVKALLWGVPLGLLASWLLYRAMTSVMDFPFLWPVRSIVISVIGILLITTATMAFARRRQRTVSIVGALRDDLI